MIAAAAPRTLSFQIIGRGEMYKQIRGDGDTQLDLDKHSEPVDIGGGLLVEGDPTYTIKGSCNHVPVNLEVKPEIQTVEIPLKHDEPDKGTIKIQTGTIYHVAGQVGDGPLKGDIERGHEITHAGGIDIETDVWNTFTPVGSSQPVLKVGRVSVVEKAGDINVETDRYNVVDGTDSKGPVHAKITGYTSKKAFQIAGSLSAETTALVVALQPFLKV